MTFQITVVDNTTELSITESPVIISEQVAGVQGPAGTKGAQGPSGVIGVDSGELTNTGTSTSAQLGLASVGTAGTYTKVTTDAFGRVSSGTTLSAGDVPTLNQNTTGTASNITGNLAIAQGGTGSTYGSLMVGHAQLNATRTKAANNTTPEAVFWDSGASAAQYFNVDADTNYFFEGLLQLNKSASATAALPVMSLIYVATGSTSTLTEQSTRIVARTDSTGTANIGVITGSAANTSLTSTGTGATAATTYFLRFYGFIRTNATTAGRINLGLTQSVAGSSVAPDFVLGSYMNVYKVGTGTASNFGNWTS